jgi:hypothetical protein
MGPDSKGELMARIRQIKPAFFVDEDIMALGPVARLMFIGMWCLADAAGRLEDKPLTIKLQTVPADNVDPSLILAELAAKRLIYRYVNQRTGKRFIAIPGFSKHQKPHQKEPVLYPDPADCVPYASQDRMPDEPYTSREKTGLDPVAEGVSPEETGLAAEKPGEPWTGPGSDDDAVDVSAENDSSPVLTGLAGKKPGKTTASSVGSGSLENGSLENGEPEPGLSLVRSSSDSEPDGSRQVGGRFDALTAYGLQFLIRLAVEKHQLQLGMYNPGQWHAKVAQAFIDAIPPERRTDATREEICARIERFARSSDKRITRENWSVEAFCEAYNKLAPATVAAMSDSEAASRRLAAKAAARYQ